jgi:hypothetical protein
VYVDNSIRNFDISLEDFKTQIKNPSSLIYYPSWNNFESSDIGEAILKLLASFSYSTDSYRSYYLENLYLPTDEVDAREQIYEMLNYKSALRRALILSLNFEWKGCGPLGFVVIPKFFKINIIADEVSYNFLTISKYMYLPNATRLYVDVILGNIFEKTLVSSEITTNKIFISTKDIDADSLSFTVDDKEWTQVRNIYYEREPKDKYSIHREYTGTYIYLPDNWINYIPSEVSEISILAATISDAFDINTSEPLTITLLDQLTCSLGDDVTDQFNVTLMKTANFPSVGTTGKRRIITLEDFENEAKSFSGVLDAKAYNWGEGLPLGIVIPNYVKLVVVGENGILNDYIKRGLVEYLTSIKLLEITLEVQDPTINKLDLKMLVNIGDLKDSVFQSDIYLAIRSAIESYFGYGKIGIGKGVINSEISSVVSRSDTRIKYVEIVDFESFTPTLDGIISLGNLSIIFDVESLFLYEAPTITDKLVTSGLVVSDNGTTTDTLVNMEAEIYVFETWYWDSIIPEAEYFEKEFFDSAIGIDSLYSSEANPEPLEDFISDDSLFNLEAYLLNVDNITSLDTLLHAGSEILVEGGVPTDGLVNMEGSNSNVDSMTSSDTLLILQIVCSDSITSSDDLISLVV